MPSLSRPARLVVASLLLLGGPTACGGSSGTETLTVFAASSLTEAFGEMGAVYRRSHPGVRLRFRFAGSPELIGQPDERVPADVLATADGAAMDAVPGSVTGRRAIAGNSMTIAVPPGNPRRVRDLADLSRTRLRVVLGASTVPDGRYARRILGRAGVTVRPVAEETGARAVLTRVRTGEADAGLVYITDMRSAGAAAGSVPIPADLNVTATYYAAPVKDGDHEDAAGAFVDWLGSAAAGTLFRKYGFTPP